MKRRAALALGLLAAARAGGHPNAAEQARIDRLIAAVEARVDLRFVRNGTAYSCDEAARFLREKLGARWGVAVVTAEDFIEQVATRSSMSGRAYLIRWPDGREVAAAEFLRAELRRLDGGPVAASAPPTPRR